jgi:hypothetical protein
VLAQEKHKRGIGSPPFTMTGCTDVFDKLFDELQILCKACLQSFVSGLLLLCYFELSSMSLFSPERNSENNTSFLFPC